MAKKQTEKKNIHKSFKKYVFLAFDTNYFFYTLQPK